MTPKIVTLIPLVGAACLSSAALAAPSACADRALIVARLADQYGETRQAIGLASASQVVEIFVSEVTGSWTITVTRPDGVTCLLAVGQHFEQLDESLTAMPTGDPV